MALFGLFIVYPSFAGDEMSDKKSSQSSSSSSRWPKAHSKEGFMMQYDTDGDGKVSEKEFIAARVISHQEKDMNGDGVVTEAEYVAEWEVRLDKQLADQRAASVKQAHTRYRFLDSDKNQDMTIDEFHASGDRTFSRYDTNADGVVTEDEALPMPYSSSRSKEASSKESKKAKKKSKKSNNS